MRISEKTLLVLLWSFNFLLVALILIPVSGLPAIFRFVGRLHPLVLHFPIVLLLAAFLFEILARKHHGGEYSKPATLLLWIGAFSAVISAIAGYLLSVNGGYSGNTFAFHQWFGLGTSVIAAILVQFKSKGQPKKYFLATYAILTLMLIVTGHFGASLTHGENFLTEVFEQDAVLALDNDGPVFTQIVQPILENKCASCHNPNKLKGGLSLASEAEILKGGENGMVLKAGDALNSTLISHLLLPTEEKQHMPPKGKPQLSNEEIKMLEWWVASGASFTQSVGETPKEAPIQAILTNYFTPEKALNIDFASQELIASLNTQKIGVKQIETSKPYLDVYIGQHDSLTFSDIKRLRKVKDQIYSLDLGSSYVDRSILKEVSKFKNLHRLYLDNTEVDDRMIGPLRKLKNLEYLNLYGTGVTKKGASQILGLDNLKKLYLWQTQIGIEDLKVLQASFPGIEINGGSIDDSTFEEARLTTPKMEFESSFFSESTVVQIPYNLSNTEIYYQLDSGEPQLLEGRQIELIASTKVTVFAKKAGWKDSEKAEQVFIRVRPNNFKVSRLKFDPKGSYKAKGIETLFDLKKGSENFRDGHWLGFNGDDMIVDVALQENRTLESVFVSTLDDTGSWIFPPTTLEVWGGNSTSDLKKLKVISITPPEGPEPKHMIIHQLAFEAIELKHLRIVARNYGDLPEWHPGKDTPAWLFIDEIAFQ